MPNIAIIGGGIAGLTCALALAERGFHSTIFEQATALKEVGAGIQLSPNAVKPFEKLGLMSAINGFASAPRAIKIYSGRSGKPIVQLPLGQTIEKQFGAPYLSVHRADLQKALAQACERSPKIATNLGAQIERVPLENGKADILGDFFDLVIAADGVNSKLRKQCFALDAVDTDLVAWRATFEMDERPEAFSKHSTTLCLGSAAHLVTYPIASGLELNTVAILPQGTDIRSGFDKWSSKWKRLLEKQHEWIAWPLRAAPTMASRLNGPFVFMGDAAHGMLPFAAQGGAMAIEDAYMLATAISKLNSNPKALRHWAIAREKRTAKVAATARQNRQIYHLPQPMAQIRDSGMAMLGPDRLMARQSWIYDFDATAWSPNSSA
jgi:salicylate hydroxylase